MGGDGADGLPSWSQIPDPTPPEDDASFLGRISTIKLALLIIAIALVGTLYVGHIHATEGVVAELQEARKANQRLHLRLNRLEGIYDQATSPAVIYRRARALGLLHSAEYAPSITVPESDELPAPPNARP